MVSSPRFHSLLLAFVLPLLLAGGCSSDWLRGATSSTTAVPLFPLTPGTNWTYDYEDGDDSSETLTYTVDRYEVIAGVRYYILPLQRDGQPTEEAAAVRNTLDGAYFHTYNAATRAIGSGQFFRYPVADGETYHFGGRVVVDYQTVTVPAGTFDAITYIFEQPEGERIEISVVPGVGMIRSRHTATGAETVLLGYAAR